MIRRFVRRRYWYGSDEMEVRVPAFDGVDKLLDEVESVVSDFERPSAERRFELIDRLCEVFGDVPFEVWFEDEVFVVRVEFF